MQMSLESIITKDETVLKMRDIISSPLVTSQVTHQRSLLLITLDYNPQLISCIDALTKIIGEMTKVIDILKLLPGYSFIISSISLSTVGYNTGLSIPFSSNSEIEINGFFLRKYLQLNGVLNVNILLQYIKNEIIQYKTQCKGEDIYQILRSNFPSPNGPSGYGYPQINIALSLYDNRTYNIKDVYQYISNMRLPEYIRLNEDTLYCSRESTLTTKSINDPLILTHVLKNCYNQDINTLLGCFPAYVYDVHSEISCIFTILFNIFGKTEVKENNTLTQKCNKCKIEYPIATFISEIGNKICKRCSFCRQKEKQWKSKCIECKISRPSYNLPGEVNPIWCAKCAKLKYPLAQDVAHPKCIVCHLHQPTFNMPGSLTPVWCVTCKDRMAVDIKHKTCLSCDTRASFGLIDDMKPSWCKKHSPSNAVNVVSKMCEICKKHIPVFGFIEEMVVHWCVTCAPKGAVNIKNKMCEICQEVQPIYGFEGSKKNRWCNKCRPPGTINIKDKQCDNCLTLACFGFIGNKPSMCSQHSSKGMIYKPTRQCENKECNELAIYGEITQRVRCETHKTEDDRNLVQLRRCISCNLEGLMNENNYCDDCVPGKYTKYTKRHETRIKKLFDDYKLTFIYNCSPNGSVCGREKPDFTFDLNTDHIVIVEVDEDQHKRNDQSCERTRMFNISQTFMTVPTLWIRYNPDNFRLPNGTKSTMDQNQKELHLLKWIYYALDRRPKNVLEVVYLFYDGCPEQVGEEHITVINYKDIPQ